MRYTTLLGGLLLVVSPLVAASDGESKTLPPWDGSRTTPVHRIPIFAESGEQVIPEAPAPLPFSASASCGPCHPYEVIQGGWHFNSIQREVDPGRAGEPWVWVDQETGTQIPISYRNWKGMWKPDDLGLTPWQFTRIFGRHMPGGDMGEADEDTSDSRWQVSGKVEINCLGCHSASPRQDQSEWAKQIYRENYRWAATAANGLGEVGGMASRVHDTWSVYDGPNPDDTQWAVRPYVDYDRTRFDSRYYAVFDLKYEPPDERCLFCHSAYPVEQPRWRAPQDVHAEAGMGCAGCHRNALDHRMIRGYEGEAGETGDVAREAFTCEGCHSGDSEAAGRFGAPYPEHRGLPPIHLERMSCTSCHSGLPPDSGAARTVRMSRINRTGIHGRARWFTDLPRVAEPVYARGEEGKIAPFRALWPAFWASVEGEKVIPIPPEEVTKRIPHVLAAEKQAGRILAALSTVPEATRTPVLFYEQTVYRLDVNGEVEGKAYDGALDNAMWGWEAEGAYTPLTGPPEFDEEGVINADIETAILAVLEALRSADLSRGQPVMLFQNDLYWTGDEGWLESREYGGETREVPFWGWLVGDQVEPLVPAFVLRAVSATDGRSEALTEEQVAMGLKGLAEGDPTAGYAYLCSGRIFRLGSNGELAASAHPDAGTVLWPLAHEVRPEEQSLGAQGCAECHREDAPFFRLVLTGTGPMLTRESGAVAVSDLIGISAPAVRWGAWRESFLKPVSLPICIAFVVLVLLHYALLGSHIPRPAADEVEIVRHNALSRIGHYLLVLSVFAVAGTGLVFLLGEADPLGTSAQAAARKIHWIVGLGMTAGLAIIVAVWLKQMFWAPYDRKWLAVVGGYLGGGHAPPAGKFNAGQKVFFWWSGFVGAVLTATGLAMLSGIEWTPVRQAQLYTIHDAAGLLMILSILLHVYLSVLVDPHSIRSVFGGRVHASWARERHSKWEAAKNGDST